MPEHWRGPNTGGDEGLTAMKRQKTICHPLGKNPGDVWHLAASNYRGAHFATYPTHLVERMLLAGCPERRCRTCRAPFTRPIRRLGTQVLRLTLTPTCQCTPTHNTSDTHPNSEPGIVLDPFLGSGTTAIVAEEHQRDWLGIELNPNFADLAWQRIQDARNKRQTHPTDTTTHNHAD